MKIEKKKYMIEIITVMASVVLFVGHGSPDLPSSRIEEQLDTWAWAWMRIGVPKNNITCTYHTFSRCTTGGSRMAYALSNCLYSNHYSSHTNQTWDQPLVGLKAHAP